MDLGSLRFQAGILLQALVRFTNQQPFYVVHGQNLVLKVEFEVPPGDSITKVIWEHQDEGNAAKTTLAQYPAKILKSRVTVDQGGAVMTLQDYQRSDNGVYTVTIQDQKGDRSSVHCSVHEYGCPPSVSNGKHVTLQSTLQGSLGTEPKFHWFHEKVKVTEAIGHVSEDGSSLYLKIKLCGHFTCLVSNKLGHSSATYTTVSCEKNSRSTTVAVVCLVLLLLLAGGLAFLIWRKRVRYGNRRERLQEADEDI